MIKKVIVAFMICAFSVLAFADTVAAPTDAGVVAPTAATATNAVAAPANAKLSEDQIPLTIETTKKASESGSATTKALMSGFIILALLGTSYYFVRKYRVSNVVNNKANMKIQILTQHYLGPKKSLAIVHVAGESILIGITDNNISMIKSLSLIDDEVPADMPKSFSESMQGQAQKTQPLIGEMTAELDEEFSFAGVTDTVSKKIKSMRSFS